MKLKNKANNLIMRKKIEKCPCKHLNFIKIKKTQWLSLLNKHKLKIKSSISPNTHSPFLSTNKILTLFNPNKNDKFFVEGIRININNLPHAPLMNLTPENCNVSSKRFIHSVSMNSNRLLSVSKQIKTESNVIKSSVNTLFALIGK